MSQNGDFKEAMARFPSGVTIVTTVDDQGRWCGFTATSFCSVSADPPLVLVCLASTAECHPVFEQAERWNIHIVPSGHTDLAMRFASRGVDKFADAGFVKDEHGLPFLDQAAVVLNCSRHAIYDGGDHSILMGEVTRTSFAEGSPALYYQRAFHELQPAS